MVMSAQRNSGLCGPDRWARVGGVRQGDAVIDLEMSDEAQAVVDLVDQLGRSVLAPAARRAEAERRVPDEVRATLLDTGLVVPLPEELGGGGVPDAVTQVLATEGLAQGDPGLTLAALGAGGAGLLIALCGTAAQQEALLPALAAGESDATVALYEGYGRSPSELTTTVTAVGGGRWRVAGRKVGVVGAAGADPVVVVGRDPEAGRLRAVLLPAGAGAVVEPEAGSLALDAARTATLTIEGEHGAGDLLGGDGADPAALEQAVGRLRLAVGAAAVGTGRRAVEYASEYATGRVAFGRPIAAFQGVSFLLAEAATRLAAARLSVLGAAERIDAGADDTEDEVTEAVNYAGYAATQATRDALQVLGGHGFITDHPVELWYRSAAALAALDFDPLRSSFEPAL
jgi:alkylation response protein AidB-like acyl-CoA dehydrogenase